MTVVDYYAVGTALAGTMGSATLSTAPPLGGTAIRQSTVIGQNNLTNWPSLLVDLPHTSADVAAGSGSQDTQWDFDVYFLLSFAAGDDPRIRKTLLMWLGALINSTYGSIQLGGLVSKAYVVSATPVDYSYGGQVYPAWHLVVRVWILGIPAAWTP